MAIARALLRDTPVVVLDEATTGLDPAACALVLHAQRQDRQRLLDSHLLGRCRDQFSMITLDGVVNLSLI